MSENTLSITFKILGERYIMVTSLPKKLFPMPLYNPLKRVIFTHLWQRNNFSVKIPEWPLNDLSAVYRIQYQYPHIFIQANRSFIKGFMMYRAKRQAIGNFTRATMLFPFYMCRFQWDGGVAVTNIKATYCALVVISA